MEAPLRFAVTVADDYDDLSRRSALLFADHEKKAVADRGRFLVALSGGSTPKGLFRLLARPFRERMSWDRTEVLWTDERCVPMDYDESNFRMAEETLLSRVPIPRERIHRIRAEDGPAPEALRYEEELRAVCYGQNYHISSDVVKREV